MVRTAIGMHQHWIDPSSSRLQAAGHPWTQLWSNPQWLDELLEQLECLEQLRALWHGYKIAVHVTSQSPGIGVDTPDDLIAARKYYSDTHKTGPLA